MTQTLYPLFGELQTDQSEARACASNAGWVALPGMSLNTITGIVSLIPGPTGFFGWKTAWIYSAPSSNIENGIGQFIILEDATVQISLPSGFDPTKNYWLVGRWKWVSGPLDVNGVPLGTWISGMQAVYDIEEAPTDWIGTGTAENPQLTQPDSNGRYGTILLRIYPTGSPATTTISLDPSSATDLAYMSVQLQNILNNFAPLEDPVFTGNPEISNLILPADDDSSKIPTTAWVQSALGAVVKPSVGGISIAYLNNLGSFNLTYAVNDTGFFSSGFFAAVSGDPTSFTCLIPCSLLINATWTKSCQCSNSSVDLTVQLYKNTVLMAESSGSEANGGGTDNYSVTASISIVLYCAINDVIKLVYTDNSSGSTTRETSGSSFATIPYYIPV